MMLLQAVPDQPIVTAAWSLLVMIGVAGAAATFLTQGLRKVSAKVDEMPPAVKQLVAVVIAWGLTQLGALLGIALPTELAQIDVTTVTGVLSGVFSWGFYTFLKAIKVIKPAAPPA